MIAVDGGGDYNQRQVLDAYWEFVRENPQDFNGWVYLIQVCSHFYKILVQKQTRRIMSKVLKSILMTGIVNNHINS